MRVLIERARTAKRWRTEGVDVGAKLGHPEGALWAKRPLMKWASRLRRSGPVNGRGYRRYV